MIRAMIALVLATCTAAQAQPPRQRPAPRFPAPAPNPDPLTQAPRETAAAPIDLGGSWKGVMTSGEFTVALADLDLTTDASKRTVTGEIRYTTVPNPLDRARPIQGGWKVKGIVDPGARTIILGPDGASPPSFPAPPIAPQQMAAVYSEGRAELAGQFRSPYGPRPDVPYFIFTRAQGAPGMKTLAEHAAAAQGVHKASGSAPDAGALEKWADRYVQEYTKAGTASPTDLMGPKGLALLGDAAFTPVFGESFDTIDYGKLSAAVRALNSARDFAWVQYVLRGGAPRIVSVAAMRTIDAWEKAMLAHLSDDPPVSSHFDDVAATQAAVSERMVYAWPSDRKATDARFEEVRSRSGSSALTANADKAVSGAVGIEGAKALAAWPKDNAANLQYASPPEREAATARINARLDELLTQLLAEPLNRLDSLGSGEAAVKAGAAWYTSLVRQFGFAQERPAVQQALAKLAARRERDLEAARGALLSSIAACAKEQDVDALFAGELGVPSDGQAGAYPALRAAADRRREQIRLDFRLSLFSEDEKQYFDRPCHIDVRKGAGKAPSKEAIRLAFVRSFGAEPGRIIDPHSVRHVTRAPESLLMPFPVIITFGDVDLLSFVPIKDESGKDTGDFDCEFTLTPQMKLTDDNALANYDQVVRKTLDQQLEAMNALLRSVRSPQHETLRLTEEGFIIPRLRDNATKEAVLDALLPKGR